MPLHSRRVTSIGPQVCTSARSADAFAAAAVSDSSSQACPQETPLSTSTLYSSVGAPETSSRRITCAAVPVPQATLPLCA